MVLERGVVVWEELVLEPSERSWNWHVAETSENVLVLQNSAIKCLKVVVDNVLAAT